MNCVTVDPERAELLDRAPGFRRFELLRRDRGAEYVVLTTWESERHFRDWVKSDLFARAHRREGESGFGGHSEVRSYEILDSEEAVAAA